MRYLEYGPLRLVLGYVVGRRVLRILHLVAEYQEVVFDVAKALWRGLPLGGVADRGHLGVAKAE